jgi:hypothetical protein
MDDEVNKKVEDYSSNNEKGYYLQPWGDAYPYNKITDQHGNTLPIIVLSAPIYEKDKSQLERFWDAKKRGDLCLGIMSCGRWPHYNKADAAINSRLAQINNSHMQSIIKEMDGWLSCESGQYSSKSVLYSESDLTDVAPTIKPWNERDIDIIFYSGITESKYYAYHKQIQLGIDCLRKIKAATGCRAIYVGEKPKDSLEHQSRFLWADWNKYLQRCKILLVSAISDASPRILTDALSNGCAIIVNKEIFGGWKYVVPETGAFFTTSDDSIAAYKNIIDKSESGNFDPSKWYAANYGKEKGALRLRAFCELLKPMNNSTTELNTSASKTISTPLCT